MGTLSWPSPPASAPVGADRSASAVSPPAGDIAPDFARQAAGLIAEREDEFALRLLVAGIRRFPDYPTGYQVLGDLYCEVQQPISAAFAYHESLKREPDNPVVLLRLSELSRQANDLSGALRYLQQARVLEPESEIIAAKLAELNFLESDSEPPLPQFLQTETAADLYKSHGYPERARAIYARLLKHAPGNDHLFEKLRQCG
jgi:predicted Zn-dependent protease